MDNLSARKYRFIEELVTIEDEKVIESLELVLKQEKEAQYEISSSQKKELDRRIESYSENPEDLLDWKDVKKEL